MHFNQFLQLQEAEQIEVLWYNGEQIGRRKEDEYLVLLYQVEGFYVEVFYHTKFKVVKRYSSFESLDRLQPYIEHIDLSAVYRLFRKPVKSRDQLFVDDILRKASDAAERPGRLARWKNRLKRFLNVFKGKKRQTHPSASQKQAGETFHQ